MWNFYSKNKFEKLVHLHLVGSIIRLYHDPRSSERQFVGKIVLNITCVRCVRNSLKIEQISDVKAISGK